MDLGNIRDNGVRRLDVHCWLCHHAAVLDVDSYADHVIVQSFAPRMVCTGCGIIGADVRPCWREAPKGATMIGPHWRSDPQGANR